ASSAADLQFKEKGFAQFLVASPCVFFKGDNNPSLRHQIGGHLLRKDDAESAQILDDIARITAAAHLLLRLLQMPTDLFIGGRSPLPDEDQFGGHLAFAGLAKPEPASPSSEMEDAVVAGGEIEPHDSLGPVDAPR